MSKTLVGTTGALALVDDEVGPEFKGEGLSEGAFVDVEVCEVESPKTVWVQCLSSAEALTELAEALNGLYGEPAKTPTEAAQPPAPDKLAKACAPCSDDAARPKLFVAAPYDVDGCYYRALVKRRLSFTHLEVHFVDFGNTAAAAIDKTFALPAQLRKWPAMALKVCLGDEDELPAAAAAKPTPVWLSDLLQRTSACLHVLHLLPPAPLPTTQGCLAAVLPNKAPVPFHTFLQQHAQ